MTYRSSFNSISGRGSPYVPRLGQQDRSFSDLFEYVDAGDIGSRSGNDRNPAAPLEDEDAPDVIHIKYMGQGFKINFPPYSISEEGVTVQELRRRIAEHLQQDPKRVRLVYKDRELRYDPYPIRKYGCKQNSEIAVVVTEQYHDYRGTDTQHSSGDDSGSGSSLKPPGETKRPRGMSSVRYRSDDTKEQAGSSSGAFLHPNGAAYGDRRRSISPGRRPEREASSATPQPTSAPMSRTVSADPNSSLGKVQALQNLYYDKWEPECRKFLVSPPSDPTTKDKEYRRLSESIMKHIIEAADAIELQGDQTARAERKKVLAAANELLKKLDDLGKPT